MLRKFLTGINRNSTFAERKPSVLESNEAFKVFFDRRTFRTLKTNMVQLQVANNNQYNAK